MTLIGRETGFIDGPERLVSLMDQRGWCQQWTREAGVIDGWCYSWAREAGVIDGPEGLVSLMAQRG